MKAVLNYNDGQGFAIERYCQERMKWETLRVFREQGDAMVFRDKVNRGELDAERYIKSYKAGTVVHHVIWRNGKQPILLLDGQNYR